jgi:rhamnosyltransferase
MIAQNPNKPVLVCTDLQIVDENLQTINNSMWQSSKILPEFLKSSFNYLSVCNFVAGCTMMFNNEVKKIVLPFSNFTEIHDSWIALKTLTHNGLIVPVYEQTILYRQHKNNVFGSTLYEKKYFFKKIKNLQSVIKKNQSHYKMIHQIKKTNIFIYLFYKFKYFLKRQKI